MLTCHKMSLCSIAAIVFLFVFAREIRGEPSLACNSTGCDLPDCRCSGTDVPGGFAAKDIPQIVLLTYDDAVNAVLYGQYYQNLLDFKNPNGCPIGLTFFVSHEYCDYPLVHELWNLGHEIADHSISHKPDDKYWESKNLTVWENEFLGMRDILVNFAKIPKDDIKGTRVPFLKAGGNVQFKMLEDGGFLWDCSMPTRQSRKNGIWPYSLKYRSTQQCQIGSCPTDSFPDLWVVPMLDLFDAHGNPCAMLDTCVVENETATYNLLMNNFNVQYNGNRAPFGLYVHGAWFMNEVYGHFPGYHKFVQDILKKPDVYVVTVSQALEYVRNPVNLTEIKNFDPWKTQCTPKGSTACEASENCRLIKEDPVSGGERYMPICGKQCPLKYPWVGNPLGV